MLTRWRRPPAPDIPEFWDRLEVELRHRAEQISDRSQRRSRALGRYLRLFRALPRPAFHGVMITISITLVATLARPPSVTKTEPATPEIRLSSWVPVAEVEDPSPTLVLYAITDKSARFVTFVATPTHDTTPVPTAPVTI